MKLFPAAPGVSEERIDKSGFIATTGVSAHGTSAYSLRGPLRPTLLTTTSDLDSIMGRPDTKVSYAHYGTRYLINKGFPVFFRRVVNNARYGGSVVLPDPANNGITADPYPTGGSAFPADPDPSTDISPTGPGYIALTLNGPLIAGNVINMNIILDSEVVAVAPTTFSTSNDATLAALATAIEAAMILAGDDGKATVIDRDPTNTANARTIGIFAPSGQNIAISGIAVTGGISQVTITQQAPYFYAQAENPGEWSRGAGYKLTNADVGVKEVVKMTFASSVGSVASITVSINGVACSPVNNTIPSDAFLQAVATAIAAHPDVDTAVVDKRPLGDDNDRTISIRMLRGSTADAVITHVSTGSIPTVFYSQVIKGVSPTGSFDFEVYLSENPTLPVEVHRVNLASRVDDFGTQEHIGYAINKGPNASEVIRIIANAPDDGSVMIPFDPVTGDITHNIVWLSAGDNGTLPTASQIAEAYRDFEDTELYQISTLVAMGYTAITIGQTMADVAKKRNDGTQAILDIPSANQKTQAMIRYTQQEFAIDSEYASAYYPDVEFQDPYTGVTFWLPPSAHVAAVYANNDKLRGIGKAPAGMRVGQVDSTALRYYYKPEEHDMLFAKRMNSIQRIDGQFYVMGDATTQRRDSALSFTSVARLIGYLQSRIRSRARYYLFEGATDTNIFSLVTDIEQFLAPWKPADLSDFKVVSAAANNPNGIIEQGNRIVDVILDAVRPMRRIRVRTTVTATGGIASIDVTEL